MRDFFKNSLDLDWMVLKPLDHIMPYWDLTWDPKEEKYLCEEDSYASLLNEIFIELESINSPSKYHINEDSLANFVKDNLNWTIKKIGNRWEGEDYNSILEQGGFHDISEQNLMRALKGRIIAAKKHGQNHFDEMEESHKRIVASILSIILYHRTNLISNIDSTSSK